MALSASDRKAAEAVASGVRQGKADNTRRAYDQAWGGSPSGPRRGTHRYLPATPQTVALYLGHLAARGKLLATIEQARAAISHFRTASLPWGDVELWTDGTGRLTLQKGEPGRVANGGGAPGHVRPGVLLFERRHRRM